MRKKREKDRIFESIANANAIDDLTTWAEKDPGARGFMIKHRPVKHVGVFSWTRGWSVLLTSTRFRYDELHHVGVTLREAVDKALKAVKERKS